MQAKIHAFLMGSRSMKLPGDIVSRIARQAWDAEYEQKKAEKIVAQIHEQLLISKYTPERPHVAFWIREFHTEVDLLCELLKKEKLGVVLAKGARCLRICTEVNDYRISAAVGSYYIGLTNSALLNPGQHGYD